MRCSAGSELYQRSNFSRVVHRGTAPRMNFWRLFLGTPVACAIIRNGYR
jgi:hypothetical protein